MLLTNIGKTVMRLITLHLPEPYLKALDKLVDEKYYPNRAEAIRVAVRDLLTVEAWERKTLSREVGSNQQGRNMINMKKVVSNK